MSRAKARRVAPVLWRSIIPCATTEIVQTSPSAPLSAISPDSAIRAMKFYLLSAEISHKT
jgi:hypothetical protein